MFKIKKLSAVLLSSVLFFSSSSALAMNPSNVTKNPSSTRNCLIPESCYFNEKKLYEKICASLFNGEPKDMWKDFDSRKVQIMDEAIKLIENYKPDKTSTDVIHVIGNEQYEQTINSCILNFERTGKRTSVATAFILHYLAEYMNLPSVIKVVICGDKSICPNVKSTLCTVFQDKPLLPDGSCFWLKSTVSGTITCDHSHYNPLGDNGEWNATRFGTPDNEYFLIIPKSGANIEFNALHVLRFIPKSITYCPLNTVTHTVPAFLLYLQVCNPLRNGKLKNLSDDYYKKLEFSNLCKGYHTDILSSIFEIENNV